ncbi:TRAP transporter small permease subunit [Hydrogenophaga sp.]|jgi:TRAP-type C4-dicarboxylate transport system permease small subunit|uniref:TRAP transporter small permease subunit n=1 Tax=Hydrogenophaga sp. TaxID=1904254 RepID=UPI003F71C660
MLRLTGTLGQRQVAALALFMSRVAGWLYVACAVMIVFDVVARNIFNFSTQATVELSGYALGCGIAWGLAGAFVARMHVRVDMLLEKLPRFPRAWLHLMALTLLMGFLIMITYGAFALAYDSWELDAHDMSALRIPLWLPQAIFGLGIFVFLVAILLALSDVIGHLSRGDIDAVNLQMRQKSAAEEAAEAIEASHSVQNPSTKDPAC